MKIIFIHGRSQQKKNSTTLKQYWTDALITGFKKNGISDIPTLDIVFPYYGDLLFELTNKEALNSFHALVDKGAEDAAPSGPEQEFVRKITFEIAYQNGITENEILAEAYGDLSAKGLQNWGAVLAALRLLNKIPGIGSALIELITRDTWYYLTKKGLRMNINDLVNNAVPTDEECIIIGHSLGSIVAYNILMNRANRKNIKKFITLGSPLGIDDICNLLPSDTSPRRAPSGIPEWFNARDKKDVVALHEISATKYSGVPIVVNYNSINNTSENHHGIAEYLSDTRVAAEILKALNI